MFIDIFLKCLGNNLWIPSIRSGTIQITYIIYQVWGCLWLISMTLLVICKYSAFRWCCIVVKFNLAQRLLFIPCSAQLCQSCGLTEWLCFWHSAVVSLNTTLSRTSQLTSGSQTELSCEGSSTWVSTQESCSSACTSVTLLSGVFGCAVFFFPDAYSTGTKSPAWRVSQWR